MNNARMALALAGGYALGRTRKMRWALTVAGVAAGRKAKARGLATEVLKSPEIDRLTRELREQVLSAGRTAAVATAGRRMEALSDRLQSRAESLRPGSPDGGPAGGGGARDEGAGDEDRDRERPEGRERRERRRPRDEDGTGRRGREAEADEADEADDRDQRTGRRGAAGRRPGGAHRTAEPRG
ncbi:hypothetical protein GCM10027168_32310 [Streptomyces capparidis]